MESEKRALSLPTMESPGCFNLFPVPKPPAGFAPEQTLRAQVAHCISWTPCEPVSGSPLAGAAQSPLRAVLSFLKTDSIGSSDTRNSWLKIGWRGPSLAPNQMKNSECKLLHLPKRRRTESEEGGDGDTVYRHLPLKGSFLWLVLALTEHTQARDDTHTSKWWRFGAQERQLFLRACKRIETVRIFLK